jgi:2-succinyl-6-hydroxy-2,4-cyclohexadiene-1-carboxylate synthase
MSENVIFALHGFLGQSSDWNKVKQDLPNRSDFVAIDLFSDESLPVTELEDYAEQLSEQVDEIVEGKKKKIFVGYSLGGRIGLHLLQNNPDQFDHYIFLSTNPGLTEAENAEKNKRLMSDMKWASQISETNWNEFVKSWNQQPVFEGSSQEPERYSGNYDLNKLKRALVMWTLAQQEDFRPLIQEFKDKITWMVGEKDSKYLQIAESMKQKKILLDYKRIFSGHRIWLDQPTVISNLLIDLLK